MKKLLLIPMMLIMAFSVSASTERANCESTDYPLITWISPIETVENNLEIMKVKILLQYGSCKAGSELIMAIDPRYKVEVWDSSPYLFWKKQPFTFETEIIKPCLLEVEITFNKDVMFKRRDHKEITLQFFPFGKEDSKFEWILNVSQISLDEASIELN